MTDFIFIYVTCPSVDLAKTIASHLIHEKLVACANLLPGMISIYRWNNEIEHDDEVILILKTQKKLFPIIEEKIQALHEAKCPCIVALPVVLGSKPYLDWLAAETNG